MALTTGRALLNKLPLMVYGRGLLLGSGVRAMSIPCELQDLEEVMAKAGVLLTGNAYDTAQDYLQDNCACATYRYLLEGASK